MDLAFQNLAQAVGPVYGYGPLIHNKPAGELLADKGLKLWPGPAGLKLDEKATVIVRAHGLPPKAWADLERLPVKVVDATCPRVLGVQKLVAKEAAKGSAVLIWGTLGHPEVEGLLGYADDKGLVISGPQDILALPDLKDVFLVAQTTQDLELWPEVIAAVKSRWPLARFKDTICLATVNRQKETQRLCLNAQALVVVGGKESANTLRLAEIGRRAGLPTLAVEGPEEIESSFAEGLSQVALTAGASTPIWQLRAVAQKLEALERSRGSSPPDFVARLFRALALSNIYVGLGAGALSLAVAKWGGFNPADFYFGLAFFYVQAMHLLNGFLDRESSRYNDPDRAVFLSQYRLALAFCGASSLFLALSAANLAGPWVLAQMLIQSALGLAYALPLPVKVFKVRRLSDLPLSKTLSIAGGWAVLLAGPAILADPPLIPRTMEGLKLISLIGGAIFLNVLTRTIIMDLEEAFGDRLFGRKTLVYLLGRDRALMILGLVMVLGAIYLLTAYFKGAPTIVLWLFFCGPLYNALFLLRYFRGLGLMGFKLDLILDAQFLLAGLGLWLL
jgi:4-hydroxy-3-methylbut-2-enyl diphosphate reductase